MLKIKFILIDFRDKRFSEFNLSKTLIDKSLSCTKEKIKLAFT